ncbi:MAG: GDP-L-fucose synthase [Chlamydiia bacterium]|nr:GDP-L-fucose synthase [Chlamydiia bacterium]MCH9616418.1 GDP-L-fucose synthase [Chlamydiia bacterium]MCH9629596.1 GDP-L-fucose synthase [Chlamydiia bacterium]
MLEKHFNTETKPKRIVLLGANGYIGSNLHKKFKKDGVDVLPIGRDTIDLEKEGSDKALAQTLQSDDTVIFLATITPRKGKGVDAFCRNVEITKNVCKALEEQEVGHLIVFSSDTVYSMHRGVISEESPTDTEDLYGAMNVAKEQMLKASVKSPLTLLRTTLVYGHEDPHNSYGPNRIRRMARENGKITLFGGGEETRDHIYIDDVVSLVKNVAYHKAVGVLNLASGSSISYVDLANKIAELFDDAVEVVLTERQNPITHRHFDVETIFKAFPHFSFTPIEEGISAIHALEEQEMLINTRG